MAILRISRAKEFKSSLRDIKIEVNGREIGRVKNGETRDFNINQGNQYIKATLDVCSSNPVELDVKGDELISLRLSHKGGIALINMIFFNNEYMKLERV